MRAVYYTCTNAHHPRLDLWNYSDRYRISWARGAERAQRAERGQEVSTRRLQEKGTYPTLGELMESKENDSIRMEEANGQGPSAVCSASISAPHVAPSLRVAVAEYEPNLL
jgi:hypothetical protein